MADSLLSEAVLLECEKGEVIIKEGDHTKFFCLLLKGAVDIVKEGKKIATIKNAGELLGELALVMEHARTATVVASMHTFCLKVEADFLDNLAPTESNAFFAKMYQFVAQLLGERLEESSHHIAQLEEKVRVLSGGNGAGSDDEPPVYRI